MYTQTIGEWGQHRCQREIDDSVVSLDRTNRNASAVDVSCFVLRIMEPIKSPIFPTSSGAFNVVESRCSTPAIDDDI